MMRNLAPGDLVKKAWDLCNQDWPGCSIMNMMHWKVIVFWGGHIVLQRFVHVRCHFQPLPTKLVFAYFDRGSYVQTSSTEPYYWLDAHIPLSHLRFGPSSCIHWWSLTRGQKTPHKLERWSTGPSKEPAFSPRVLSQMFLNLDELLKSCLTRRLWLQNKIFIYIYTN